MIRFALLGLGAGAVYALTAQGIVVVYRGSGVLNFAHGAVGMIGAFAFYTWRADGMAVPLALALALLLGAAIGVAIHVVVMRPLRRAPPLARLIATLGLLTLLLAFGTERWGDTARIVPKLLPIDGVKVFSGTIIGRDRLMLAAIALVLTLVLQAVYRFSQFGRATTAVAESRMVTASLAVSPDLIAAANWAVGTALAVFGAILIVNVTGLQVVGLTLLVIPALAAALVGGFRSFPLTLIGGLAIGILESEVAYLQTKVSDPASVAGLGRAVPFLVIISVLVVRGRALPLRSEVAERPPEVGSGKLRPITFPVVVLSGVLLVGLGLPDNLVEAATSTAAVAIVALSLTVVTGFAGQLSLAQFALAGMGAWMAARLVVNWDLPFELAAIVGILGAIPLGVAIGLPALRTRGVNLAVVTLGLALVIESLVLNNSTRTGGITGTHIGVASFLGIDLNTAVHPERYAVLAILCLAGVALVVANLRRGRTGRRLIAVRTNERAAAALGISVFGAKLYAFGLAAGIAAVGGILIAFRRPNVVFFPTFAIFESILVVVYSVIGGVGFVTGAVVGSALAPRALVATMARDIFSSDTMVRLFLGVLVIVVLMRVPNGLASIRPGRWLRGRKPAGDPLELGDITRVEPLTLEALDVSVRFGAVTAVNCVSLAIRPGEVIGLIGPNGAGKTTLIDALSGFARVSQGEVRLNGRSLSRGSAHRRAVLGIGRSFQSLELFESMTVRENLQTACDRRDRLAYLTDLVRPGRAPLGPAAVAAVREFGLEADLDRRPEELPYGKRRLVAIARAVAARPSVLLLDEPAAGLGESETAELGLLVRRLAEEWGMAILLVEHDVMLVLGVCDRVAVLDFGRKIAEGTPDVVRDDSAVIDAYLGGTHAVAGPSVAVAMAADAQPSGLATTMVTTGATPLIACRGLAAGYGDLAAVRDLDLEVRAGEVVALLGANGAGKTTTLLTLAGELAPLAGEMDWKGSTGTSTLHRRAREGLAFVPEERAVVRDLSVADNLKLARADQSLAFELFPELAGLASRRAGLLSGGEQQMLTLARALGRRPTVLLADELSLGLAPMLVQRLLRAIRSAADDGVGVILVEQYARQALEIADRVYVLRRGRVVLEGSADELRRDFGRVEQAYLAAGEPGT